MRVFRHVRGARRRQQRYLSRSRKPVVVALAMFALVSVGSVGMSVTATTHTQHREVVVQVAARQRTLAERYAKAVLMRTVGLQADPDNIGAMLQESGKALLDGGLAPAVNGDDDETQLSAATDPIERAQLAQQLRLVADLIDAGDVVLAKPGASFTASAGEGSLPSQPMQRLKVLSALTSNVALNASRTIADDADQQVAKLLRLEIILGAAALATTMLLGWMLVAAIRRQTSHFSSLVQSSSDLVAILDEDGRCLYVSPSVTRLLGVDSADLLGAGLESHVHPEDASKLHTLGAWALADAEPMRVRVGSDEEWRDLEATVTDLRRDRHVQGIVLNSRDITERVALERQLNHLAFHDPLTGLANRALFHDRLQHAMDKAARGDHTVAVVLTDLDQFKQVNDSLGHDVGDQLLATIAHRLAMVTRSGDTVARLGGDEFALVLEDTDERDARAVGERILVEAATPVHLAGRELLVGASVGVAMALPGSTSEELVRQADVAMYAAKHNGRGRVEMFHPELAREAGELLGLVHEIHRGLERGEFVLHYQPEVALDDGRLLAVEALMRWVSPRRGLIGPVAFIPAAESSSAILAVGEFALYEACEQTARWEREHDLPEGFITWVNISAKQLSAGGLRSTVEAALAASGLNPRRLGVELTETSLVADGTMTEHAQRELDELHEMGVRLAIDDFGTGFSSLAHLRRFTVDALKVDQTFVAGIDRHGKDAAIAGNVISLAHALGVVAIAEGIETDAQLVELRKLGCDLGQGFLFARPAAPEAIAALLPAPAFPGARDLVTPVG